MAQLSSGSSAVGGLVGGIPPAGGSSPAAVAAPAAAGGNPLGDSPVGSPAEADTPASTLAIPMISFFNAGVRIYTRFVGSQVLWCTPSLGCVFSYGDRRVSRSRRAAC